MRFHIKILRKYKEISSDIIDGHVSRTSHEVYLRFLTLKPTCPNVCYSHFEAILRLTQ